LFNQQNSAKTPFYFNVKPSATNETTTTIANIANVAVATVNVEEIHYLYAKDIYNNA